jgi:hypothetical protein
MTATGQRLNDSLDILLLTMVALSSKIYINELILIFPNLKSNGVDINTHRFF